jgi:hypothetical protein
MSVIIVKVDLLRPRFSQQSRGPFFSWEPPPIN